MANTSEHEHEYESLFNADVDPSELAGGAAMEEDTFEAAAESEHISPGMYDAIMDFDFSVSDTSVLRANFYRIQSNQEIGTKRFSVPIYFEQEMPGGLDESWISPLENAMQAINEAAPGLRLHRVRHVAAKIFVVGNTEKTCYTMGNIILNNSAKISLEKDWNNKNGTAIHEMMHALGFQHEHRRSDGEKYLRYDLSKLDANWKLQYQVSEKVTGITGFDPHSVMMYPLCEELQRNNRDIVWDTKHDDERCQVLSELDKVGLNIMYRPVEHAGYKPTSSSPRSKTGLMYCNRTYCGQDDGTGKQGPNCPACRVLKTEKSEEIRRLGKWGKWQGWTGLVYCGQQKGRQGEGKGLCGPDEGEPCTECASLIGHTGNRS